MTKIIMLELSLCNKNCVIKKYNVFARNGSDVAIYSFLFFNPIYYFDDWITSLPLVMTECDSNRLDCVHLMLLILQGNGLFLNGRARF